MVSTDESGNDVTLNGGSHINENCRTLDKPLGFLISLPSGCFPSMSILFNLAKSLLSAVYSEERVYSLDYRKRGIISERPLTMCSPCRLATDLTSLTIRKWRQQKQIGDSPMRTYAKVGSNAPNKLGPVIGSRAPPPTLPPITQRNTHNFQSVPF